MKRFRLISIILLLLVAIYFMFFFKTNSKKAPANEYIALHGATFGTFYHVTYAIAGNTNLQVAIDSTLRQVDSALSMFNQQSIIARINAGDTAVCTNALFDSVFLCAQRISTASGGAFDITVAPLVNFWGFGFEQPDSVCMSQLDSLMPLIGYHKVRLENHHIIKDDPHIMLDASAIAKGFGCDCVANTLEHYGVTNYMIEIGGEVRTAGHNAQGNIWRIGINKPVDDTTGTTSQIERVVPLANGGMATSGNYRNFYTRNGQRFAHTIDPHTGRPVQHSLLSATVTAADCMTADAVATACMVLGVEPGMALCKQLGLECFFIYAEGDSTRTIWSKGFQTE